jgi:septation ring formation regulator EzrA
MHRNRSLHLSKSDYIQEIGEQHDACINGYTSIRQALAKISEAERCARFSTNVSQSQLYTIQRYALKCKRRLNDVPIFLIVLGNHSE